MNTAHINQYLNLRFLTFEQLFDTNIRAHIQTAHESEAAQADSRFMSDAELQKPAHKLNNLRDLKDLVESLKDATPEIVRDETATVFTVDEYQVWRAGEAKQALEARATQIEDELRDPFIRKEAAFNLLDELAEITVQLDKE